MFGGWLPTQCWLPRKLKVEISGCTQGYQSWPRDEHLEFIMYVLNG